MQVQNTQTGATFILYWCITWAILSMPAVDRNRSLNYSCPECNPRDIFRIYSFASCLVIFSDLRSDRLLLSVEFYFCDHDDFAGTTGVVSTCQWWSLITWHSRARRHGHNDFSPNPANIFAEGWCLELLLTSSIGVNTTKHSTVITSSGLDQTKFFGLFYSRWLSFVLVDPVIGLCGQLQHVFSFIIEMSHFCEKKWPNPRFEKNHFWRNRAFTWVILNRFWCFWCSF